MIDLFGNSTTSDNVKIAGGSRTDTEDLTNESLFNRIEALIAKNERTAARLATVQSKVHEVEKKHKELKATLDKIEKDKIRIIEVLGFFVTFFTFVSFEVRILEKVDNVFILAGLSVIMFSGLALFISVLMQIAEYWIRSSEEKAHYKGIQWKFLIGTIILTIIGLVLCGVGFAMEKKNEYNIVVKSITKAPPQEYRGGVVFEAV